MGYVKNLKYLVRGQIHPELDNEKLIEAELEVVCAKYGLDITPIYDEGHVDVKEL